MTKQTTKAPEMTPEQILEHRANVLARAITSQAQERAERMAAELFKVRAQILEDQRTGAKRG